ncbi:Fanconi anemia group I protein-like [Tubulanus polymorphus]|uniref:Fanconi anemia group I protein-like n=1 Tax=Tubulanus polymorphus TaxID=672921 RepID=UPI003DA4A3FE
MEEQIVSLTNKGKIKEIARILSDDETAGSEKNLKSMLDNCLLRGKEDPTLLAKGILEACEVNTDTEKRQFLYKHCMKVLQKNDLNNKTGSALVGLLLLEVDNCPANLIATLTDEFVSAIQSTSANNGKHWELLPKMMTVLSTCERVVFDGDQYKGTEYNSLLLEKICLQKWDKSSIFHFASVLKDAPLSCEDLKMVVLKIVEMLSDTELEELPPLIYQLLLLSSKAQKTSIIEDLIVENIVKYFKKLDESVDSDDDARIDDDDVSDKLSVEQLRYVEGTIMLHITFAVRQDQQLGRGIIKYIKTAEVGSSKTSLCPFSLALALSLAKIHRFEKQVFDCLKTAVLKSFKDCEKQEKSWWIRQIMPTKMDITECMIETAKNSKYGWDDVAHGLVNLGFVLMDSFTVKSSDDFQSPQGRTCLLGANVLKHIHKIHSIARVEILDQILHRVISSMSVPQYLDLLGDLIKSMPQLFMESLPRIRETLDYLAMMPAATAVHFLRALQPLLRISSHLKDSLLIVLRKSLFSRHSEAREFAINGYLIILKHVLISGDNSLSSQASQSFSSSQSIADVHIPMLPSDSENTCLEILNNMRRCLNQQAKIRQILYEGLHEVVNKNSKLKMPVLDILLLQFQKAYEHNEDVNPPVKIDKCTAIQDDSAYITEPLPYLLSSMVYCLLTQTAATAEDESTEKYSKVLNSVTRRMIKAELEDFEVDKSADFNLNTASGVRNLITVMMLMGIYEVLISYQFLIEDNDSGDTEKMLTVQKLFDQYNRLYEIWSEKSSGGAGGGAGKKDRAGNKTIITSMMTVDCASNILHHLVKKSKAEENVDFKMYIVRIICHQLQQVNDTGHCDTARDKRKIFYLCCSVANDLLHGFIAARDSNELKKFAAVCLNGFNLCFQIICGQYEKKLSDFLTSIEYETSGFDMEAGDGVHCHVKKIQDLVMKNVVNAGLDSLKEILPLLNVIGALCKLDKSDQKQTIQTWFHKLCKEKKIEDCVVSHALLSHLIDVTRQVKNCSLLLKDIAQDIHVRIGDVDEDVELDDSCNFAIVNKKTANTSLFMIILSRTETDIEDAVWALGKVKSIILDESLTTEQKEALDKGICTKFGSLITGFHELVQTAIPTGNCATVLLKQLTKFYNGLTALVKFYIYLYNQKAGHCSGRFEKVVKLSGTLLTNHVYTMISYLQSAQPTANGQQKEDKKKTEKKNTGSAARVLREARSIPQLIFCIEQYEKFLIQLSKKAKINFMEHMKHSTSRDFRINTAALQQVLTSDQEDENDDDDDNDDGNEDEIEISDEEVEDDESENAPPAKRSRLGNKRK